MTLDATKGGSSNLRTRIDRNLGNVRDSIDNLNEGHIVAVSVLVGLTTGLVARQLGVNFPDAEVFIRGEVIGASIVGTIIGTARSMGESKRRSQERSILLDLHNNSGNILKENVGGHIYSFINHLSDHKVDSSKSELEGPDEEEKIVVAGAKIRGKETSLTESDLLSLQSEVEALVFDMKHLNLIGNHNDLALILGDHSKLGHQALAEICMDLVEFVDRNTKIIDDKYIDTLRLKYLDTYVEALTADSESDPDSFKKPTKSDIECLGKVSRNIGNHRKLSDLDYFDRFPRLSEIAQNTEFDLECGHFQRYYYRVTILEAMRYVYNDDKHRCPRGHQDEKPGLNSVAVHKNSYGLVLEIMNRLESIYRNRYIDLCELTGGRAIPGFERLASANENTLSNHVNEEENNNRLGFLIVMGALCVASVANPDDLQNLEWTRFLGFPEAVSFFQEYFSNSVLVSTALYFTLKLLARTDSKLPFARYVARRFSTSVESVTNGGESQSILDRAFRRKPNL